MNQDATSLELTQIDKMNSNKTYRVLMLIKLSVKRNSKIPNWMFKSKKGRWWPVKTEYLHIKAEAYSIARVIKIVFCPKQNVSPSFGRIGFIFHGFRKLLLFIQKKIRIPQLYIFRKSLRLTSDFFTSTLVEGL